MSIHKELCQEVITILQDQKKTLFTAESCTAGLITASLTDIPGASAILLGGIVAYSNMIKHSCLKVSQDILDHYGAVSFECVTAMAVGAIMLSNADYGLAITGIAGPSGGSNEKPVGTVYTAVTTKQRIFAQHFILKGTRDEIRLQSVELGLKILLAIELEKKFFDSRLINTQEITT
ncbi:MAG: CinA family protein [Brevinema sp.]